MCVCLHTDELGSRYVGTNGKNGASAQGRGSHVFWLFLNEVEDTWCFHFVRIPILRGADITLASNVPRILLASVVYFLFSHVVISY